MKNTSFSRIKFPVLIAALLFTLLACSDKDKGDKKDGGKKAEAMALEKAIRVKMACDDFRDSVFEHYQNLIFQTDSVPKVSEQASVLQRQTETLLLERVADLMAPQNAEEHRQILGALMVGDRSTPEAEILQQEISLLFAKWAEYFENEKISCESLNTKSDFSPTVGQMEALQTQVPLGVWGIRKAFATAYQSCQSLRLKPLDRRTDDLEGIVDAGAYPGSSVGRLHKITDKAALVRSHYYIKDFQNAPGCVNVKELPMVYDFGGKPYVASADPKAVLNYWIDNKTTGSRGLGIDCSGYVFSSLAAGGLRLREGKVMKASESGSYPARMYLDPANNGFSCLKKVTMGKSGSLQAGDILASKTHVALVASVGVDPLALNKYSDCNMITYRDFDFVISQSSPEHNQIGINMYEAREYLAPFLKLYFRNGLEKYAREACQAARSGRDKATSSTSFAVSRHKMTSACLQSEIKLEGQSCIDTCNELLQ